MPKPQLARDLHFPDLDALLADARQIADHPDTPARGQWSPAQIIWHIAKFIDLSVHGYPFNMPWYIKLFGKLMKKRMTTRTMSPGIKLPTNVEAVVVPSPDTTVPQAMELLERSIEAANTQGFLPRNPILGPLSRDQWVALHCRHAEMHFALVELPRNLPPQADPDPCP